MITRKQKHFLAQAALVLLISLTVRAQINPFDIDKNREQEKSAQSVFQRAMDYYREGDYWAASREMVIVLDHYPHFSHADEAYFILGNCLNEMGLLEGAEKMYKHLLKKHIYSEYAPYALLGLQRVNYQKGDLSASLTFYEAAIRGNPSPDIIDIANYYTGISYYKLGDYPNSVKVFMDVSSKSPYYDYVLYNLAKSLLRMQRINQAVDIFHTLLELPVINDDRRRILNEVHLTLGYLYYELGYFEQSIEQFGQVTPDSDIQPEALLASGWAAAKMQAWERAIDPLTELYAKYRNDDDTQEGLFLLGRCYLKLNRFDEAITIYDRLITLFQDSSDVITTVKQINADLKRERRQINERQTRLLALESTLVNDINLTGSGSRTNTMEQTRLMRDIQKEREELQTRLAQLDRLAEATATKEERRNWRAYAEYGKIRATFLKRRAGRRQSPPSK